jgi:hypothetical protein
LQKEFSKTTRKKSSTSTRVSNEQNNDVGRTMNGNDEKEKDTNESNSQNYSVIISMAGLSE